MSTALLDADIIAYRCTAKNQMDFGDGPFLMREKAVAEAAEMVREWTRGARCTKPLLCFSGRDGRNYRKELSKGYKAGRKEKPPGYWDVVDALEAQFPVARIPALEADDVLGISATHPNMRDAVIVSIDKDLMTVPARLFNPAKMTAPARIRPLEADLQWLTQTLTGDSVDGYKGCPKVGPKKAEAILSGVSSFSEAWEAVVLAFAEKDLDEDVAIENARMARILRYSDYDSTTKRILLWHPNPTVKDYFDTTPHA